MRRRNQRKVVCEQLHEYLHQTCTVTSKAHRRRISTRSTRVREYESTRDEGGQGNRGKERRRGPRRKARDMNKPTGKGVVPRRPR